MARRRKKQIMSDFCCGRYCVRDGDDTPLVGTRFYLEISRTLKFATGE